MATKDDYYDPPVNYESESDDELNNEKIASCSLSTSPLDDVFIHNDLSRKGGMLDLHMDPQRRCQGHVKGKQCINEATHNSSHYSCSLSKRAQQSDPDYIRNHRFCRNCAEKTGCPFPGCAGRALSGDEPAEPL